MIARRLCAALVLSMGFAGAFAAETAATSAARQVLAVQRDAWNRADIDACMRGYWHSDAIRFAGGADFQYGWDATIARYRKAYPDAATMGKLDFDLVAVRELAPDVVHILVDGRIVESGGREPATRHGLEGYAHWRREVAT